MPAYTLSNKFKRIKNTSNIRPDIRRSSGYSLTFLKIKCPTIKDRIIEILEDQRSKHYKYCYDQVDDIRYLYDLDLFRQTGTQNLKLVSKKLQIENRLKKSLEIGGITLQEYKKQISNSTV